MPFRWREPVAPVAWGTDTRPFTSAVEPKRPGRFVLGQVDDDTLHARKRLPTYRGKPPTEAPPPPVPFDKR
jgi:hypothetical protein